MTDEQNQPGTVATIPEKVDPERAQELLASINRVQLEFIADAPPQQVFGTLLENLLTLSESDYGFIGQVLRLKNGTPFLKTHAISDIAWNEETRRLYQENAPNLEFHNLDTLFGRVMVTGKPVIANDPTNDVRANGNPLGHPPLRSFLGIPFHSAGQMVGMVGIVNRQGGYDEDLIRFLEPFLSTCAHIIVASENAARRRLAESAMHRQALVFENLYDGVVLTDWEGRITDWNPGAERLYGYRREEVLGELPDLFYKPAHGAVRTQDILDCVDCEGRWTGESLFVRKDGRTGFSETVVVALRDEQNRPVGTVGVNRDITDRKRAETVLRRQALVFENLYDGVIVTDWEGRITDWNTGAERMFGYTREEVLGQTPKFLDLPERAASLAREILEDIKQKGRWAGENVFVRKDGSTGLSEMVIVPLHDEHDRPIGTVAVNRDITERRRSEEALRQSEERFRFVTQATRDAIYDWDIQTNGVWRNEAYIRQYGPDSTHAVGGESGWWIECIHPADRDGVLTGVQNALESNGDRWTADYRVRTTDGSYADVIDMSFIIRDHRGEPIRMIGAMMDITDRKKAEDALRAAHDELEQRVLERTDHLRAANESLQQAIRERTEMEQRAKHHQAELAHVARISTMGEMAAGLAHELNQPLASISNYADSCVIDVQRDQVNPADLLDCLNRISEEALRAGQIIRRLRNFVRKAPPRRSSIDLNELVGEIVEFLDADARRLDIRVHVDLAGGVRPIQADPIQIEQVVLNLLRNGMESIKSTDQCDRELRIQTSLIDDTIEFSMHDNGRGVPTDIAETIFDPFVTTKADGLGLGLSISRSIIEAHGGRLWADLDEACGATFRFRIPLVSEGEGANG